MENNINSQSTEEFINQTTFKERPFIQYPIKQKVYMHGPGTKYNIPYSPIHSIPSNTTTINYYKLDSEKVLYESIDSICNLTYPDRYILYMDCMTLPIMNRKYLEFVAYTQNIQLGNNYNLEQCRCISIADFIRTNTLKKYSVNYPGTIIYGYIFRYYMNKLRWNYIALSPIPSMVFKGICTEIHKMFSLYYTLIIFGLDNNLFPYMDVFISNRTKLGLDSNIYLSKDFGDMNNTQMKIMDCVEYGTVQGSKNVLDLINERKKKGHPFRYELANDVLTYRQYTNPTIGDLDFQLELESYNYLNDFNFTAHF